MIRHQELQSSLLSAAAYDDRAQVMYLQFNGKGNQPARFYSYPNVPKAVWTQLLAAPSRGRYFLQNIRQAFAATQIQAPEWNDVLAALPKHVLTIHWEEVVPVVEFA